MVGAIVTEVTEASRMSDEQMRVLKEDEDYLLSKKRREAKRATKNKGARHGDSDEAAGQGSGPQDDE